MSYIPLGLFALLIVAADQISKYFVVERIAYGSAVPFWEGILHLTYVQNYGAAFSFLQGHRWLFIVVFVVFVALLFWGLHKKVLPFARFELWCLAAILGGGLGNILDRVFRGYVVDMFNVLFMRFAVFNVADICVVLGDEKKVEKHHDPDL